LMVSRKAVITGAVLMLSLLTGGGRHPADPGTKP
jgi:hypothetical protein